MTNEPGGRTRYRCSFCNKEQEEVRRLIAGPNQVFICDECIALCREIIDEEERPGERPTNQADAPAGDWTVLVGTDRALSDADQIALFDRMARDLYVAVISDILDKLGYRNQAMRSTIRPVLPDPGIVLVGRAATVLYGPQHEVVEHPYTMQIAAIDALKPGDVVIQAGGGLIDRAFWGELFSNAARARGARGTIIDGCHRDTRKLLELGYPVFSTGARPLDISGRGTVISYGRPVECGGVLVRQGDVVFAEIDGIVVIPQEVAETVVEQAFAKAAQEDRCRDDLRAGALLREVWQKYKVL